MIKKKSYLTFTDQFCGAGGSSQGVREVAKKYKGVEIKLALNHWKLAIETHNTNFPDTLHDCTDISACDPRRYPSTDILITSPECTNHSLAKGKKIVKSQIELFNQGKLDPAAERSRATMWDVPRFAEYHNYNAIIVENVVDARKWVMFDSWLHAMHALGYDHKCVYLNSKYCHPTPQSRDRMYVVFWKRGNKAPILDYQPPAWCRKCEKNISAIQTWKKPDQKFGKYLQQYVYCCPFCTSKVEPYYYAAFNCIDWSDIGTRIGDRIKPLSENTIKRIEYGIKKYGKDHFVINDQHSTGISFRTRGVLETIDSITTTPRFKLISPFILKNEHSHGEPAGKLKSSFDSFQTQTARQSISVIVPYIIEMNRTGECKPIGCGINHALLVENKGKSKSKPITDAAGSITTIPHLGIVTTEAWNTFIAYNYNGTQTSHITEATDGVNCRERLSLINYQQPNIEDCYYRMLKPHEIKLAMAFDKDYIVLGSGKDQVKQCGNAVTPPAMKWLAEKVINSFL